MFRDEEIYIIAEIGIFTHVKVGLVFDLSIKETYGLNVFPLDLITQLIGRDMNGQCKVGMFVCATFVLISSL